MIELSAESNNWQQKKREKSILGKIECYKHQKEGVEVMTPSKNWAEKKFGVSKRIIEELAHSTRRTPCQLNLFCEKIRHENLI